MIWTTKDQLIFHIACDGNGAIAIVNITAISRQANYVEYLQNVEEI